MSKVLLGSLSDIPPGQAKGFDPNQTGKDTFFVVRQGNQLFAYTDICPHYGNTTLPWKRHHYLDSASDHIVCAAHGALFEIDSGTCVQGPCLGQKLLKIPIEVSSHSEMWISLETLEEFNL
ncbi:Rieske (2Fe-2S) protein [Salinimonas lutimaris]|uniref:Rieske (2Fe-2S) protein n=1 Tax=Salinimonas lutimaris TaxID=914153 RepID=UPI0010C0E274|nr:Rieske (2Fe-2S) protein [Salinimonas lutimaris]